MDVDVGPARGVRMAPIEKMRLGPKLADQSLFEKLTKRSSSRRTRFKTDLGNTMAKDRRLDEWLEVSLDCKPSTFYRKPLW